MAKTYATLNPLDKGTNISLSNGNLTATAGIGTWETVRANQGVSTGKWYWEYVVNNTNTASSPMIGVAKSTTSLSSYAGASADGYVLFSYQNQKVNNNVFVAYGITFLQSYTVGVALDMDSGTITLYYNNSSQGTMYSGLTGTFYPAISINIGGGISGQVTANFGATTMAYSAPSGYNQGLYTGSEPSFRVRQMRPALFKPGNSK